ncbi:hypothetical protein JR782_004920 [Salmonella enterica subsp. enterica serovar Eastbourne]|nr:hypothetical protein [Salmonella enterica subsp. enterica serovar Eastbourne]EHC5910464.1 hypothetical protein [Salmonella enterica subsp. enterica serovar Eastbourne]EJW4861885.1 hypothetical protein [Salmonella enterica]
MSKAKQQTRIRKIMIYALNAALRAGVIPLETASCYFNYPRKKKVLSDKGNDFFAVYVRESTVSYIDELEDVKPFGYSISELSQPLQRITSPAGGKRKEN